MLLNRYGWPDWKIDIKSGELISPSGQRYTPDTLRLLEWKSCFYDRGRKAAEFYPDYPGIRQDEN